MSEYPSVDYVDSFQAHLSLLQGGGGDLCLQEYSRERKTIGEFINYWCEAEDPELVAHPASRSARIIAKCPGFMNVSWFRDQRR